MVREMLTLWRRCCAGQINTKAKQLRKELPNMLYYALVFFLIALFAGVLGFGGIAVAAAGIAKILFFIFLVLFILSLIGHTVRRI
jgi:uncharacterized membrane protein YtjA (UPF0391 family)